MIETGGSGRLWLLTGPAGGYALHLTERDELLHLHWGARIALSDAEALAADPLPGERPGESALDGHGEYPLDTDPRAVRPALSVRPGDPRGPEWCFEEYEIVAGGQARADEGAPQSGGQGGAQEGRQEGGQGGGAEELRLHFHDSRHHLDLTLHYRIRPGSDVVERWSSVTHVPGGPGGRLELLRADAATWSLPYRDGWQLSRLHGRWGAESRLARAPLPPGEQLLAGHGHAGQRHLPWFALDAGDAGEEHGEVWTGALGWSGPWRIALSHLPGGLLQVGGGADGGDPGLAVLEPGARYTSPVFAALWTAGGFGAASRAWHPHQLAHTVPDAGAVRPVAYHAGPVGGRGAAFGAQAPAAGGSYGGGAPAGPYRGERRHRELARRAAAMGVELFVVDDGPPGARLNDAVGHGDREPGAAALPDGLKPLSDEVHALGMRFGVRVDAETVGPDSDLCRAHPEWITRAPGGRTAGRPGRMLLDLARADVRDHLAGTLGALLHGAPVDHLVWESGHHGAGPGLLGEPGERCPAPPGTAHVAGLYALMDRLHADHPGVTVESSAGGGRVDLGMLERTGVLAASRNSDALDRLHIQHGFGQLLPARALATWVTGGPAPGPNHRRSSLRFRFVSAMSGALGIGGDLLAWGAEECAEAASWIALHASVRPVVQAGALYRLRPPGDGGLTAVQYVLGPDTVVLAWLPAQGFGTPVPPLRLRGLDRGASYRDMATGVVQRGAVLAERGLRTTLAGDLDAAVFHLRRV